MNEMVLYWIGVYVGSINNKIGNKSSGNWGAKNSNNIIDSKSHNNINENGNGDMTEKLNNTNSLM